MDPTIHWSPFKTINMASNAYHFTSKWRVKATREEVYQCLQDAARLPEWWGDVYLKITVLDPGHEDGTGKT